MAWAAVIGAGGALLGGYLQGQGASSAAGAQAAATAAGIRAQKQALAVTRKDLKPYRGIGAKAAPELYKFTTNPNAQKNYLTKNPLFDYLVGESRDNLFANQAARGKLGSGATANMLTDRILGIGTQLIDQQNSRLYNLAALGENAAARTGVATQNTAANIGELLTQQGNAQAAGIVGQTNAITGTINGLANAFYQYQNPSYQSRLNNAGSQLDSLISSSGLF